MKIGAKVMSINLLLVLTAVMAVGGISLYSNHRLTSQMLAETEKGLEQQAMEVIKAGVRSEKNYLNNMLHMVENDAKKMATSGTMHEYLTCLDGSNEVMNESAIRELQRMVSGINNMLAGQNVVIRDQLASNVAYLDLLLKSQGNIALAKESISWPAMNQFTSDTLTIELPAMMIGESSIKPNETFDAPSPLVDDVVGKLGGACTIFQRMNEQGDMLRIATTVKMKDGRRAIGTYIPAVKPGGESNPVIESIMQGKPYAGRVKVVGDWYLSNYAPLKDVTGAVIGMIFCGINEQEDRGQINAVLSSKIGKLGYTFVMESTGNLLVHPKQEIVGKNVLSDLKIKEFESILKEREAGKIKTTYYQFEGRSKYLVYGYYEAWDWIICASGYVNELSETAASYAMTRLRDEVKQYHEIGVVREGNESIQLYNQIRFLDEKGMEIIKLEQGKFSDKLTDKGQEKWFQDAIKTPAGELYVAPVEIAKNTGEPELRLAAPVFTDNKLRGLAVFSINWGVTQVITKNHLYGKSGYPYLINDKGVLITHPKYNLKDNNSLADAKYGELSKLVQNKMLKGEAGGSKYVFEEISKFVYFEPFKIGPQQYTLAVTSPEEEFMEIAKTLKQNGQKNTRQVTLTIVAAMGIMSAVALVLGLLMGRAIVKPIQRVLAMVKDIASGEGDLTKRLPITGKDEIGELSTWFNTFIEKLHGIISSVSQATHEVAGAAAEIAAGSEEMAVGIAQQSDQTVQISSAVEELAATVTEVARKTSEVSASSSGAEKQAQQGGEIVGQTVEGINSIARMVEESAQAVTQLGHRGEQIGEIINVINDIADQTNLLALNAAIEAARAGEHGRGFAVVADEVRKLAERTTRATKEIAESIKVIQSETGNAVIRMNDGTAHVAEGVKLAGQAGDSLRQIVTSAQEVAGMIQSIASATEQQSATTMQIAQNLDSIMAVTRQSNDSASHAAQAAAQLSAKAEQLQMLVTQFKL